MKSDEFVREVDEAVRRERWLSLWQHYRAYIIGTAIAVAVGTGAGVGWRQWQENARLEEARSFASAEQLLGEGRALEAASQFAELADESDTGFVVLARLRQAEALGDAGDLEPKREALRTLADDDDAAPAYRSLARLLEAHVELQQGNPGAAAGLIADAPDRRHWQASARELEALSKVEQGEIEAARALLGELIDDPATPVSLRERALELQDALTGSAAADVDDGGAAAE